MATRKVTRPDWRETVAGATDLAVLGVALLVAALPVVTAGGAVAAASAAVDHWCTHRTLPPVAVMARTFVRGIVPGLGALAVAVAGAAVLMLNVSATARGAVPGGPVVVAGTVLVLVAAAGLAGLAVVRVGQQGGTGWVSATAWAWRAALRTPAVPLGIAGLIALTTLVGWMMPVVVPVIGGIGLLGLHAVTRRAGWAPERA
ncbi:hypothetical protein [Rugosimonospora africana]|uniref:Uncharacterized protein n=1 Tax=Rugosimonospora africana TaxID=556532 RepID=A0A8J3QVZ6_9ACTN|nr:hypothetical protein [Rugosimonospora africana]GIH17521.1 hypothetical protein Raf01_56930 [Rugosimonospora africana]